MITECWTVSRAADPGTRWPYWAAVRYTARPRKSDGRLTWRRSGDLTVRRRSETLALRDGRREAGELPYLEGIRQNAEVAP